MTPGCGDQNMYTPAAAAILVLDQGGADAEPAEARPGRGATLDM